MNVFYATDENYCVHTGVSIVSLLENNKNIKKITVYILEYGVSMESHNKLFSIETQYKNAIFVRISGDDYLKKIKEKGLDLPQYFGNITPNFILFIGELLPPEVDRVLCLDSDTLVLGSLKTLFHINMDCYVLAAVKDWGYAPKGNMVIDKKYYSIRNQMYFNSGVILFNLNLLRRKKLVTKFIEAIKNHKNQLNFPDQDILNYVVEDRDVMKLPCRYNYWVDVPKWLFWYRVKRNDGYSISRFKKENANIRIIHFLGYSNHAKSWHKEINDEAKRLYIKYRSMTQWKDDPLESFQKKGVKKFWYFLGNIINVLDWTVYGFPRKILIRINSLLDIA